MVSRSKYIIFCVFLLIIQTLAEQPLTVRAKRQQCRCTRNPSGSMTCSCIKPTSTLGENLMLAENQQQADLATELQTIQTQSSNTQARCACLQIVFHGNPQYQCQCGDVNGNPLPTVTSTTSKSTTTTTMAPTTTPTTTTVTPLPTTTTTTAAPTTSTSLPTTTTAASEPIQTTTQGQGQCQCIMIRISGPASAHYQCNCPNTQVPQVETLPEQTTELEHSYTIPATTQATTQPFITTQEATSQTAIPETYPLTTTCIMYVGVQQATSCSCLPQYDQCAQNICCLQAKYRSLKKTMNSDASVQKEPSTIDMLMNVLQQIKTKFNN